MSKKTVSHLSDIAEQAENVPDVTTPILTIEPDDGTLLKFHNNVESGDETGLPVFFRLYNEEGEPLPTDTKFVLRALRPGDDEPITVSTKESHIASWNQLDLPEQQEKDNIDSVKIELEADRINIRDKDELRVEINSDEAVSWDHSELYFYRDGVTELPFSG